MHAPASMPLLRGSRTTLLSFVHRLLEDHGRSLEGPAASLYVKKKKKKKYSLNVKRIFRSASSSSVVVPSPVPLTYNKV